MKKKKLKTWHKVTIITVITIIVLLFVGVYFLFNFAFKKGGYSSVKGMKTSEKWVKSEHPQELHQTVDGKKEVAYFIPAAKKTNKTVMVVHGYGGTGLHMNDYIKLFHNDGYNVVAPDNQSSGKSQGEYAGYGWGDRTALLGWMKQINQKIPDGHLGLFGISMGASAVMFTLPKAPKNVDFAIEDCGYNNLEGELKYELNDLFHLPSFPIIQIANLYCQMFAKYNLYQANAKPGLEKNKIPLFIIQGSKDTFVPTENAYVNYREDHGPKKIWIVKNATHADAYNKEPKQYNENTRAFAEQYFK